MDNAQNRYNGEIDKHDRREQRPDFGRAAFLQQEQQDQQDDSDRQDQRRQTRFYHSKALNRRKHGNRRCNHAVAIEKRRGEHAQEHCQTGVARRSDLAGNQRDKSETAALPLVVGAHQDPDILDRDHQCHRPEDQADDAQNMQIIKRQRVRADECFAEGIKRTGADIAEHDADCANRQLYPGAVVIAFALNRGRSMGDIGGCWNFTAVFRCGFAHAFAPTQT